MEFEENVWKGFGTRVKETKGRGSRQNAPRNPGMMNGLEVGMG